MNEGRRYRILETLGRGGFGTVYRAELLGTGGFTKQVAIKMLTAEGQASDEIVTRLRDEARILGLLRHRAVVGVDSLARLTEGWAVVMEYVPGVDLTLLVSHGPPPAKVAMEVIEEVSSALHAAYNHINQVTGEPLHLIHRDIKPANIRITGQGEVKVLDFGVAQADFENREARTQSMLFGSFRYMAPERIEGVETTSGDIFGLGLVLAELLSAARFKSPPKDSRRYGDYLRFIRQAIVDKFEMFDPPLTPDQREGLLGLVSDMMAFDREDRPTAKDVEQRCRDLRAGMPGAWLRDWAETEIPRLESAARQAASDPMSGSLLVERTAKVAIDGSAIESDEDETRSMAIQLAALSAGVFALAALLVITVAVVFAWYLKPEPPLAVAPPPAPPPAAAAAAPEPAQAVEPTGATEGTQDPEDAVADPEDAGAAPVQEADQPSTSSRSGSSGSDSSKPSGSGGSTAAETADTPPPPPKVRGGVVNIDDSAGVQKVWLIGDDGAKHAGGDLVPAGSYKIQALFEGMPEGVQAGTVVVREGDSITLRCNASMLRCVKPR